MAEFGNSNQLESTTPNDGSSSSSIGAANGMAATNGKNGAAGTNTGTENSSGQNSKKVIGKSKEN